MRILWVSVELPDRDGQGGQRRQFHQIAALRERGHEITVLCPAGRQQSPSLGAVAQVRRPRLHVRGRAVPLALRRVRRLLSELRWDAVLVSHHDSAWLLPERLATPVLLDLHNVISHWHRRSGRAEAAAAAVGAEAAAVDRADAVTTCSRVEADRLQEMHPDLAAPVFVAPLGVAPHEWPEQVFDRSAPRVALFGGWGWEPNRLGLTWFVEQVWPLVRAQVTAAQCLIAGSGVPASLIEGRADDEGPAADGLSFVGRVDDLAAFTATAAVVAVPVQRGVGAALKYAESLASGAAVVATADAAGAFAALPLPDAALLVSDDPGQWATWIVERLQRRHVEAAPAAGRDLALSALTWDAAVQPVHAWLTQRRPGQETEPR